MKVGKVFILLFIVAVIVAGCRTGGEPQSSGGATQSTAASGETGGDPSASAAATQELSEADKAMAAGRYDPPIEITTVSRIEQYTKGDTRENNVHTRWALERLGIKMTPIWEWVGSGNDQYKQKLTLALSSGEQIPDFVPFSDDAVMIGQMIDSGAFMPIDELFDKYANQTLKEHAAKHPEMWYPFMKDGKKYALPVLEYLDNDNTVLWLREDWMQKLGLSAPQTIADLENIMDKFKNENPDGLAPKDVYPLAVTLKGTTNTWMSSLDWLFGAYGAVEEQWNLAEDGTLEYGSINPAAKQALAKLREWMQLGYLHPDAGLWDQIKAAESWSSGKAGILPGSHWIPDWPGRDLVQNVTTADYKAYPVPAGPDGKIGTKWMNSTGTSGNIFISKDAKHPEAIFLYYNHLLDNLANPPVGGEYEHGFAQGYDWEMVDGEPTQDASKFEANSSFGFIAWVIRIPDLYMKTLVKLADGGAPETPFEKQQATLRNPKTWQAAKVVVEQSDVRKRNYFNGAPTPTMQTNWNLLQQSEYEMFNKIIYSKVPVDEFDKFVQNWKQNGGDQITKEVNDWYKSISGQ